MFQTFTHALSHVSVVKCIVRIIAEVNSKNNYYLQALAGVSISSEVGGRTIKVGGCNTSGAVRPLLLGGSGGLLP